MPEEFSRELGPVGPDHERHAHETFPRDPAGCHGKGKLLRPPRMFPLHPPAKYATEGEEHAVVPVEGPREADARRRGDEVLVSREYPREKSKEDAHEAADHDAPRLDGPQGLHAVREGEGDRAPRLRRGRRE